MRDTAILIVEIDGYRLSRLDRNSGLIKGNILGC